MASKKDTQAYGMRVVAQKDNNIGLRWEVEGTELVLYSYSIDEHGFYSSEKLEEISISSACDVGCVKGAFSYLRKVCNRVKPSYRVYITQNCYNAIKKQYMR